MKIYPACDIKDGKCVRLRQGRYDDVTIFSDSPLDIALKWESMGAQYIHLVDLDGAKSGKSQNYDIIVEIANKVKVPVQIGGGIRNMQNISDYLSNGVARVILGTSAVKNPELVRESVSKYGERIAVGIDAKDGMVAIQGWEEVSEFPAIEFAKAMCKLGVKTIIYTDIATDGMLQGPNITAMSEMADAVDADIIASGGVTTIDDIRKLLDCGVEGAIIGKALYTDNIDLSDAIAVAKGEN